MMTARRKLIPAALGMGIAAALSAGSVSIGTGIYDGFMMRLPDPAPREFTAELGLVIGGGMVLGVGIAVVLFAFAVRWLIAGVHLVAADYLSEMMRPLPPQLRQKLALSRGQRFADLLLMPIVGAAAFIIVLAALSARAHGGWIVTAVIVLGLVTAAFASNGLGRLLATSVRRLQVVTSRDGQDDDDDLVSSSPGRRRQGL